MKQRVTALLAASALLFITACGGHGGSSAAPPTESPVTPFTGSPALADFDWGKSQLQGAALIGPAQLGHMQVSVVVSQQNARGLLQYAQEASDPGSPLYRRFLTPQQIADRFGASQQDYRKAANYFAAAGLHVAGWPQRLALAVAGPQAAMEKAFGTKFGLYEKDGRQFVAPTGTPHFSSVVPVTAVQDLVAIHSMHAYLLQAPPRFNAGTNAGYSPQQVQNAFGFSNAYKAGFDGSGITIGIIGTGPIDVTRSGVNPCGDRDLAALQSLYHVANVAQVCEHDVTNGGVLTGLGAPPSPIPTAAPASPNPVTSPVPNPNTSRTSMFPYAADFQTPPPVTAPCKTALPACNPEDGEAQLDTQQAATLAPAAQVDFYLAYNASDCYTFFPNGCATPPPAPATPVPNGNYGTPQLGIAESDPEIEQAIGENTADVISISYGGGETQNVGSGFDNSGVGFESEEFAALAAEGVAVFVSSGDNGAAECLSGTNSYQAKQCVSYPSGDPNVTSVGGVNAPLNEFGQIVGNITAWGTTTSLGTMGSGGGVSTIFSAPSWQSSAVPGTTMRTQPDVAMIGDPFTGVSVYGNAGISGATPQLNSYGGTSVSAPEMAAMWALVLQACKANATCSPGGNYRLGNAAPYLYSIYAGKKLVPGGSFTPALPYADVFYDVKYGSNAMVNPSGGTATPVPGEIAGPGYDQTTGVGVPFAGHLIQAVTGQAVP